MKPSHHVQPKLTSLFSIPAGFLICLFMTGTLSAQVPGVELVHGLSGATAGEKIQTCIDLLQAEVPPVGGTCDARGLRGGTISNRIRIDQPNVRILLGPGTFTLTGGAGFQIMADNVILEGQGGGTHLDGSAKTGNKPVVDVFDDINLNVVRGARVRDLKVTGNKLAEFVQLVRAKNTVGVRIEGVEASHGGGSGIVVRESERALVLNNHVSDMYKHGIVLTTTASYCEVAGNMIEDVGQAVEEGITGTGGISVIGDVSGSPKFIRITNNTVRDASAGIRVTSNVGKPSNIMIANNTVNGTRLNSNNEGEGISTSGDAVQILGNRVNGTRVNGMLVWGNDRRNVAIADNMISNTSLDPLNIHNGISLNIQDGTQERIMAVDNLGFDDQAIPTMNHLLTCNKGVLGLGTVVDLYAIGNVGSGFGATALSACAAEFATTSGNLHE